MRKIIILMSCFAPSLMQGQASIDTIANYKSWGWNAIVMKNDLITLATVPAIGGRVMQYDLGNHSSIFVNPAELGKTYTPRTSDAWKNFGGYKTWPAPQGNWPGTWPPPPTLDRGSYSFQIDSPTKDSAATLVTSPIEQWIAPGIQFERRATIYPGTSRVRMEQTIINTGASAVSWGMWSITQSIVNHPGKTDYENFWVYFPINPNSIYGQNGVLPDGSSNAWKGEVAPGVYGVQFTADNKKIYADPQIGWIAYSDLLEGVVYARTFEIFEGAPYPDNARVTVYVSAGTAPIYVEVEVKAPVVTLPANGGRYTFTENWWAAKVRGPVLDINKVGAIAGRLSYNSATHTFTAMYGVFHTGTARLVCIDSQDHRLSEGRPIPVSPLLEFQLQETVVIPDSTMTIELRMYNANNEFIGVLERTNVSDLSTAVKTQAPVHASEFHLEQNFPNPFNPGTTILYELQQPSSVKVVIYDLQGREIKLFTFMTQSAGRHHVRWDGTNDHGNPLSSGVYLYRVMATSLIDGKKIDQSGKMTLVK